MSAQDVCALLIGFGVLLIVLSWVGRRKGDAPRDVALMFAVGAFMAVSSGVVYVAA